MERPRHEYRPRSFESFAQSCAVVLGLTGQGVLRGWLRVCSLETLFFLIGCDYVDNLHFRCLNGGLYAAIALDSHKGRILWGYTAFR